MLESILSFDHHLFTTINSEWTNVLFDYLMPLLRNKLTWLPLYCILLFIIIYKEGKQAWKPIVLVIIAVGLSDFVISQILKNYFDRIRPCIAAENINSIRLLIKCSNGYSFPSAHASNHACLAIFFISILCKFYPSKEKWIQLLFIGWAISIAYAQVYVGVHYPLDVTVGLILGFLIGTLFIKLTNRTKIT